MPARRLAEKLRLLAGPRRALGRQVGADLARTLRRRTVPAVMAVLLAVMTGALVLVNGLAATQDRAAVASTGLLVGTLLQERSQLMRRVILDYAGWEEAYVNLHQTLSIEWAYDRQQLGPTLQTTFGFDLVLVVTPDGSIGYAFGDGRRLTEDQRQRLDGGFDRMIEEARRSAPYPSLETVPVVGGLRLDGAPAIAGAAAVIPPVGSAVARAPGIPTVLVFVDRLTAAELVHRGDGELVAGLRLVPPGPELTPSLPLQAYDGTLSGRLTWDQSLPGSEMRRALLPWLWGGGLAMLALLALAMHEALFAAKALVASEIRFRDVSEAASDWIWETDARQRLVYLSARFHELTGFAEADALGQPLARYLALEAPVEGHRSLAELVAARPPDATGGFVCCYRTREGQRRSCRVAARAVRVGGMLLGFRGTVSDITVEVEAQREVRHMSLHDPLTGLPNRILLIDRLGQALRHALRHGGQLAVLCIDLDRFKPVNDTWGHAAGDAVLRETARRLRSQVRETDTVARVGGDEFVVVTYDRDGMLEIETLSHRLLHAVTEPIELAVGPVEIGLSIGIARFPGDAGDLDHLLSHADLALYEAKQAGRGTYRFFSTALSQRLSHRRKLEHELRCAVEASQFELEFQPRVRVADMRLVAAEALLRWRHPLRGRLAPAEFLGLAEETGLVVPIGAWALRQACRRAAALGDLAVSVNVAPAQFKRGDLVGHLRSILAETGLPGSRLELELTEGTLFQAAIDPLQVMQALKAMGIRLALDDFGTGYSSLSCLRRFPFDRIKIDRSFIADIEGNAGTRAIVRSVLSLGRALGLAVTAEGVETEGQLRILRAEGCDEVQGYLIGRPAGWDQLERTLADSSVAAA
ncbi:MAG: EAL domain-containing protein [Geminicoccaceae bacterium]